MHGGNAKRFGGRSGAKDLSNAETEDQRYEGYRKVEIVMGPESLPANLRLEAPQCEDDDQVDHHYEKRETANSGNFADLDESNVSVERDSETIPAKSCEEHSAQPFERCPGHSSQRGHAQVV